MAYFNMTWTPSTGNVLDQVVKYRLKGAIPWEGSGIVPGNPQTPTNNAVVISGLLDNNLYEFQIDTTCLTTTTPSVIVEDMVFACLHEGTDFNVVVNPDGTVSFSLAGLVATDLNQIQISILNSTTHAVVQTSPIIPIAEPTVWVSTPLAVGAYYAKVQYGGIINGSQEMSNFGPGTCRSNVFNIV